jgi:hypothetical protein
MLVRKTAALDRFEGKQAILILEHGQEFRVLKEELSRVHLNQILQSDSPSHE